MQTMALPGALTPWAAFSATRLLLCEGIDDAVFLRALLRNRNIGNYDVRPVEDLGGVAGNTGFGTALITAVPLGGFRNFRHIVIVADGDTHYNVSFQNIVTQINFANTDLNVAGRFAAPAAPYMASGGAGYPRITVMMLPRLNTQGALETLLWEALVQTMGAGNVLLGCVLTACGCTGANGWGQSKWDKAKVHATIALVNRKHPDVGLVRLWRRSPNFIPLNSAAFTPLADALAAI